MNNRPPRPKAGDEPDALASAGAAAGTDREPGEQSFDPKPLAAYRLGLRSFDIWKWHKLFWAMPGEESTWNGVPLAVEHLRDDRLILADEIHQNVFAELPRVLDDLDRMAEVLIAAWVETGKYREREFGSRIVPGRRHWDELRILADRALGFDHPLRSLFGLGAAVGEYQLALWDNGAGADRPPEMDTVPAIRPLVSAVRKIPGALLKRIPQLRSLVELSGALNDAGQEPYLQMYLGRHPEASRRYSEDDEIDIPIASQIIDGLDSRIEEALRSMPDESGRRMMPRQSDLRAGFEEDSPDSASGMASPITIISQPVCPPTSFGGHTRPDISEPSKPVWNSEFRRLCFEGKVVRTVKRRNTDIEVVLNDFQAKGWPKTLLNPFNDPLYPNKIHELIDSLNCELTVIRFHADGTQLGISWGRIPTP